MSCANLINLAAILQVLQHLNDFQIIGYCDHFVFQNEAENCSQAKHLQTRTSHGLFFLHYEALEPIIKEM